MLEIIAAVGGGLFVLSSLVVGGRLMWTARTTRGLPEFVLGAALFLMGGLGYPLMTIAIQARSLPDGVREAMLALQMVLNAVGMCGVAWFTRRVFRPAASWSLLLWLAVTFAYAGLIAWQTFGTGLLAYLAHPRGEPWHHQTYVGVAAMTWAGVESLIYWGKQRRRLALGLADAVVADRFRLWGVAILTADSISCITLGFEAFGVAMIGTPAGALIVGSLGLVASTTLALAFWPPVAYVERIRRSAGAHTAQRS